MKKRIACFNLLHPYDVTFSDECFIFVLHDFSFSAILKFFEVFLKRKMLTSDYHLLGWMYLKNSCYKWKGWIRLCHLINWWKLCSKYCAMIEERT